MNKLKNRERNGHSQGKSKRHSNGYTNTHLANGHRNAEMQKCRNRCLLFSFFLYFLIDFHILSEMQVLNGHTNTSLTRTSSLRTSRCLLFSLFGCCYFLIYFYIVYIVSLCKYIPISRL